MPGTRPARCLFRLSDAKVMIFHYTANILQVFFIVSCIFFVFSSLGSLCRGCFLVFLFVFSLHPCGLPLIIYVHARTRAGVLHGWRAAGVGVEASTTSGGSATAGGAGSCVLVVDPLRPSASSPLKRGQCRVRSKL